jgi:hypothetical protein
LRIDDFRASGALVALGTFGRVNCPPHPSMDVTYNLSDNPNHCCRSVEAFLLVGLREPTQHWNIRKIDGKSAEISVGPFLEREITHPNCALSSGLVATDNADEVNDIPRAELLHDVSAMKFNGPRAYLEKAAYLLA